MRCIFPPRRSTELAPSSPPDGRTNIKDKAMTNKEKKEAINKMKKTDPDLTIEIKFWENGMGIQTNNATPMQKTIAAIALIN